MSDAIFLVVGVLIGAGMAFGALFAGYHFGFKARNLLGNAMGELFVSSPADPKLPEPFGFNPFEAVEEDSEDNDR